MRTLHLAISQTTTKHALERMRKGHRMSISETTLALTIDGKCNDAVELLACLTLLGFDTTDAMLHVRDAVRCGLVSYAS